MSKTIWLKWFLAVVCLSAGPVYAASFSVGTPTGSSTDGNIVVPINFSAGSGEMASTMQFDLHYDPSKVVPVEIKTGAVAKDAGKAVSYNIIEPGHLRVVEAGMNQKPVATGSIADIVFKPVETEPAGKINLKLSGTVVSDGTGTPIASNGVDGVLDFGKVSASATDSTGVPEFEPAPSSSTGTAAAGGGLRGRVVIPGLIDKRIDQPAGSGSSSTSTEGETGSGSVVSSTGGSAQSARTVSSVGAGQSTPSGQTGTAAGTGGVAQGSVSGGSVSGSSLSPAQTVSGSAGGTIGTPSETAQTSSTADSADSSDKPATVGRRTKLFVVEGLIVVGAIILFIGARKMFHV